jgi:hypothetical protein
VACQSLCGTIASTFSAAGSSTSASATLIWPEFEEVGLL